MTDEVKLLTGNIPSFLYYAKTMKKDEYYYFDYNTDFIKSGAVNGICLSVIRHPIGAVRLSFGFDREDEIILTLQNNRTYKQLNNNLPFYNSILMDKKQSKLS
jgi:hypothetical protein